MTHIEEIGNEIKNLRIGKSTAELAMLDRRMFRDLLRMSFRYIERMRRRGTISLLMEADLLVIEHAITQMIDMLNHSPDVINSDELNKSTSY